MKADVVWPTLELNNIADIIMGQSPPGDTYNENAIGLPLINGPTEFGKIHPRAVQWTSQPTKVCRKGDVLICVRGHTTGRINRADKTYCIGRGVAAIRSTEGKSHSLFVYYALESIQERVYSLSYSAGSTFPNITKPQLGRLAISLPPLEEQNKIAGILWAVDQAICKLDEISEAGRKLRSGLSLSLLTYDIPHENRLITSFANRAEWKLVNLADVVEINKESCDPSKEFPNQEFLYVDIESIVPETGLIGTGKKILGKDAPSRARRILHKNNVIMSTVRPYLKAFAIVPEKYENQICSTGFAVLTCKKEIIPAYLLHVLFSNMVIDQCNRMMVGGQYPALNQSQVAKIQIPLPPLDEQQRIADTLSAVNSKMEFDRMRKESLVRLKKSLMADLLAGKTQLTALQEEW